MTRSKSEGVGTAPLAEELKINGQTRVPFLVGGIGPASQIPLLQNLLRLNTGATSDQQHIGYGLVNATSFPDRTTALKAKSTGDSTL